MRANYFYRHPETGKLHRVTGTWDTVPVRQDFDGLDYDPETKRFDIDWNNHEGPVWDAAEPICDSRGFQEFHVDELDLFDVPEDELEVWAVDEAGDPIGEAPLEHTPTPSKRKVIVCAGYVIDWDNENALRGIRTFDTEAERDGALLAEFRAAWVALYDDTIPVPDTLTEIVGQLQEDDECYGYATFEHEAIR